MGNTRDFVVTVHALERFQERFPTLWTNDRAAGRLIHEETMAALDAGRSSHVPPLELANHNITGWAPGKSLFVWTPGKERGYVLVGDAQGEMTVATVLVGEPHDKAREKLYGQRSWRYRGEDGHSHNEEDAPETGVESASAQGADERQSVSGAERGRNLRCDQGA